MNTVLTVRRFDALGHLDTPLGPLRLAASARGLAGVWFDGQAHHPGPLETAAAKAAQRDAALAHIAQAMHELRAYFDGGAAMFEVALDPAGTDFQQAVWRALRTIAPGGISSYAAVARAVGRPAAVRAVGAAVGRNPLTIIVPCHRVLGSDGSLTGYAGGLERKRALLAHEQVRRGTPVAQAA